MKKITLLSLLTISLFSCKKNGENNSTINIENLQLSPVVHEKLNQEQLDKIKFIHKTFNEVYLVTLEETIKNFKRDQNPDNEINIWLNMAKTYESFALKNSEKEKLDLRKEAFKLILMRSMMSDKEAIKSSDLRELNNDDALEILKNYSLEAKPIKVSH